MDATKVVFSTVQDKGATQIPSEIRAALGLENGDKVAWKVGNLGNVYVTRAKVLEVREGGKK